MTRKPLAIIQMGRPPEDLRQAQGEQSDWMLAALDAPDLPVRVCKPHDDEALPEWEEVAGAVLTGSWSMVTDREPWSERTAEWLRGAHRAQLPLLGICYGHQLMAHALGGVVDFHPQGREIGQHAVDFCADVGGDALFGAMPPRFLANLTHEQSVLTPPPGAEVLARSQHDPHQVLRYGRNAWSVQFHPEFSSTLMSACLSRRAPVFEAEGYDVSSMVAGLGPTHDARQLLRTFARRFT
ncbi:glutamine amidotransferase [Achromobacter mucicolens]|uniref:glutamine amidotransferase n=1 Tax=Achromobacter mucicolens TaxID=1389922 RepID=UPI00244D464E|nr:glutamine amidotransferase [Achromobacter mucicolens]MDH0091453.1 glutamine amidotransferase [Achromobacter mucicolens]